MLRMIALLAAASACLPAATLERLAMDDMISRSSAIVRARVTSSQAAFRGPAGPGGMIYTWYNLQVVESLKGANAAPVQVAVPGGFTQGLRQTIAGAPVLQNGQEYVLFIWTSRSGLPQLIGMSQGLFDIRRDLQGNTGVHRAAITEPMLDPVTHKQVADPGVRYTYEELKSLVLTKLGGKVTQ